MRRSSLIAAVLAAVLSSAAAPPMMTPNPSDIVAAAPATDWRAIPADELLVMELGEGTRAIIALAPAFAPIHVANIRALARAHWWDGTSINRVQDNYVVQWGDATERKPLPPGIVAAPPAEYERPPAGLAFRRHAYADAYASQVGHVGGWPVATDGGQAWLAHCYGMVGVGRNLPPDTGSGAELYAVIGQAPRHLDRNIALVGRVIEGMETLAARPRGTGPLGFFDKPEQRIAIRRVRLASDMTAGEAPGFEVLDQDSSSFAAWVAARANRADEFFVRPAGALDLCNALPPVRRKASG